MDDACLSKGSNDVERNYDVHDQGCWGIIQRLECVETVFGGSKHE